MTLPGRDRARPDESGRDRPRSDESQRNQPRRNQPRPETTSFPGAPRYGEPLDFGRTDPPAGPRYRNTVGTLALIVGVLSLVVSWTVVGGIVLGATAVVLGLVGRARVRRGVAANRGTAIAGIVTGAVSIVLAVVLIVLLIRGFDSPRGRTLLNCVSSARGDEAAVNRCLDAYRSAG